jgi:hypothetical protein
MLHSRKFSVIARGVAIGIVFALTLSSFLPAFAGKPGVIWSENPVKSYIFPGGTSAAIKQVTFTSNKKLKSVALEVSPELDGLVSVQPAIIPEVSENIPQTITLSFSPADSVAPKTYTGTITIKEKVKCKDDNECSEKGKVVPDPLPVTLTVLKSNFISSSRDFGTKGKVTISGVNPASFNPPLNTIRFDITGTTLRTDTVSLDVNRSATASQNLQVTPSSVTATLSLAEGRNNLLLSAGDTDFGVVFSEPTLWVGSNTLNVSVLDETNQPLTGAVVTAKLGDDQAIQATATSINGSVTFPNLPNRTILLEAKASGNRIATLATTGRAGLVQLRLTALKPASSIDNNDFSQGTAGWDIGSAPVQIIPHNEGNFVPLQEKAAAPQSTTSTMATQSSSAFSKSERKVRFAQSLLNQARRRAIAPKGGTAQSLDPLATGIDNDLVLTTQGEGPKTISRTFQAPVGALQARIRYKFITSEVPGGYFGTQFNDSFNLSIRSQSGGQVNDIQTMNGLGLSTFDASGATDWRVVTLPLNGNSDTIQLDMSVSNVGDGLFDSQLIADYVGTPKVAFGPLSGVIKGDTADLDVTVQQTNPPQNVTLTLSKTSGTGAAQFAANNSNTLVITQSGKVRIKGITESSQRDNIRIQATVDGVKVNEADELFSVVWVTLSFRNSGSFSSDNDARDRIVKGLGQDKLGTLLSNGILPPLWRTAIEMVGSVSPKDYQEKIILNRTKQLSLTLGEGIPLPLKSELKSPGDLSLGGARDDDPRPNGKIYDFDAPGTETISPSDIIHYRGNFKQFAVLGGQPDDTNAVVIGGTKASTDLPWFTRISVIGSSTGDVLNNDIPGDNISGQGTTPLTWNLQ